MALLCFGINFSLLMYGAIYLPYIVKQKEPLEDRLVNISAFTGLFGALLLVIACWPVWGKLTIPILFAIGFGFLNINHFLPGGKLGNYSLSVILIVSQEKFCS